MAWTEALTKIAETHAPDATFAEVRKHFSDDELVALDAFDRTGVIQAQLLEATATALDLLRGGVRPRRRRDRTT